MEGCFTVSRTSWAACAGLTKSHSPSLAMIRNCKAVPQQPLHAVSRAAGAVHTCAEQPRAMCCTSGSAITPTAFRSWSPMDLRMHASYRLCTLTQKNNSMCTSSADQ